MTEERKKELAEETIIKMFPGVTKEHPMTTIGFMQLIDTVAAEARKEGMDEMRNAILTIAIRRVAGWFEKRENIYDKDTYVLALAMVNTASATEAERLLAEQEEKK